MPRKYDEMVAAMTPAERKAHEIAQQITKTRKKFIKKKADKLSANGRSKGKRSEMHEAPFKALSSEAMPGIEILLEKRENAKGERRRRIASNC